MLRCTHFRSKKYLMISWHQCSKQSYRFLWWSPIAWYLVRSLTILSNTRAMHLKSKRILINSPYGEHCSIAPACINSCTDGVLMPRRAHAKSFLHWSIHYSAALFLASLLYKSTPYWGRDSIWQFYLVVSVQDGCFYDKLLPTSSELCINVTENRSDGRLEWPAARIRSSATRVRSHLPPYFRAQCTGIRSKPPRFKKKQDV
jgi:hypothetical protein